MMTEWTIKGIAERAAVQGDSLQKQRRFSVKKTNEMQGSEKWKWDGEVESGGQKDDRHL